MRATASLTLMLLGLLTLRPGAAPVPVAQKADAPTILAAVATYLDEYERKFSAVVAREDYVLSMTSPQATLMPGSNAAVPAPRTTRRGLRSDVMMLNLGPAEWVQFRDVYEVDGRPVGDHTSRMEALLARAPSDVLSQARQIANESARYNLGVARNFNVPTMALAYLGRQNQPRSTFTVKGSESVDGQPATVVEFKETAKPGIIRALSGDVTTHGRFWIAPTTGAVLRSEIDCQVDETASRVEGTVTVSYQADAALGVLVPIKMDEEYRRTQVNETDAGHATYADFRLFTVDTAAIRRGGGGR